MKLSKLPLALASVLVLFTAACGDDDDDATESPATTEAAPATTQRPQATVVATTFCAGSAERTACAMMLRLDMFDTPSSCCAASPLKTAAMGQFYGRSRRHDTSAGTSSCA